MARNHARASAAVLPRKPSPYLSARSEASCTMSCASASSRYLTRNDADAQDIVQDASLRALKYGDGFRGSTAADARAWFLAIVRNTAYTWRQRQTNAAFVTEFNEDLHSDAGAAHDPAIAMDLRQALDQLPLEF